MSGYLFAIDGTDGTGKNTQAKILYNAIKETYPEYQDNICLVSFPRYGTPGCSMVDKYLHGEFGMDPNDIDPYTASMFYTIDRVMSFKTDEWGEVYRNGGIVIADRYYTSNIIHQGAKLLMNSVPNDTKKSQYIDMIRDYTLMSKFNTLTDWIINTETNKIGLPVPNKIFWLMANKESNEKMLDGRAANNKSHNSDIHEANKEYLDYCRDSIIVHRFLINRELAYANKIENISSINYKEEFINVINEDSYIRPREDIHKDIFKAVEIYLAMNGIYPERIFPK